MDVLGAIDNDVFHGEQIVKPRYAFFLHAKEGKDLNTLTIRYTTDMMARSYGQAEDDTPSEPDPAKPCMTISAQRGGNSSTATVVVLIRLPVQEPLQPVQPQLQLWRQRRQPSSRPPSEQ